MDWHNRRVLFWRASNTLDTDFCVDALEEALWRYGPPDIFNTDQGFQAFMSVLKSHDPYASKSPTLQNTVLFRPNRVTNDHWAQPLETRKYFRHLVVNTAFCGVCG